MNASEESVGTLIQQLEARERRARLASWLFILVPALVVGAMIWFSASQLSTLDKQLKAKENELASYGTTLETTQNQLVAANQQVDQVNQKLDASQQQLDASQKQLAQTQNNLDQAKTDLAQAEKNETALKLQLDDINLRLSDLQQKYTSLQQQYNDLQLENDRLLNSARNLRSFTYLGDPALTIRELALRNPLQSELFSTMLNKMSNVPWKSGGVSPQEGFDSPGFAAYMLANYKLISQPAAEARDHLRDLLNRKSEPRIGDIVFYELGYTMFFYQDSQGRPFVVGMTPLGVLALRYDFAKIIGFGQVDYAR